MVKKVKYIGSSIWKYMTLNKVYDVVDEDFGEVKVIDDEGDECWFTKDNFKLVEETKKTLMEYFMELHNLKEGDEFKIAYHYSKIEDGRLYIKAHHGDYWVEAEFPLHMYDKFIITKKFKNETQ